MDQLTTFLCSFTIHDINLPCLAFDVFYTQLCIYKHQRKGSLCSKYSLGFPQRKVLWYDYLQASSLVTNMVVAWLLHFKTQLFEDLELCVFQCLACACFETIGLQQISKTHKPDAWCLMTQVSGLRLKICVKNDM